MKDNRWRLLDIFTQLLEGKPIKISELVEKKYGTEDTIRKDKDSIRDFLAEKRFRSWIIWTNGLSTWCRILFRPFFYLN